MPLLTIELVPESAWFSNVRSEVTQAQWDQIRKQVYAKANHRCEICDGVGSRWPVECHEVWHYDDTKFVQTLKGMIALCPSCHQVKHFGFAQIRGKGEKALQHLMKVNGWNREEAEAYVDAQFELWHQRSQYQWELNISVLEDEFGICL